MTEQLDEGISGKLTLVCAPAGFGKTTLLSEWVLRSEFPVGWLSLDGRDNDPTRFLSYVITAIQTVVADTGEDALSLLRSPQPVPIQVVLTALVNELAAVPHDLALVLDDYHVIDDEAIHAAVAFLLEHLPPQMHLTVASRTDLPLALSRLRAGGNLTRLSDSDLQFTPEEAAAFLNDAMSLELSPESVAALEKKTEGWIAGLQLAALSLRGRDDISGFISAFAGTNRHVFDYLAEEVLDRQLEDTRTFLLQTSILDRLSGPLCDAVTGRGDAQTMLEKLEGANLLGRLLIAQSKPEEASKLLQRLLEAAEAGGRGRTVIEVLVLKALALRKQNHERGALATLRRALTLAEPEGFVRVFLDEGAPMLDLLRRVLKAQRTEPPDIAGDVPLEYVGKLLAALGAHVTAPSSVHVRGPAELVLDPITEREMEVLKLLDSELSNREIAARMFVSLATVKTHIKHLYRKLGVTARHQAVARANKLRLL